MLIFKRTILLVQHLALSFPLGDCVCTEHSPNETYDTRCCTSTTVIMKMSKVVLETCTGV